MRRLLPAATMMAVVLDGATGWGLAGMQWAVGSGQWAVGSFGFEESLVAAGAETRN
jgi:hypothetical protein